MCIASENLLSFIDPLPMDRLILHDTQAVRGWPSTERDQLLAVPHRDLHVARRNVAELTRYLDDQSAHLAACAGAEADHIPLMMVETFPRLPAIRSDFLNTPARECCNLSGPDTLNFKKFMLACPVILHSGYQTS